MYPDRMDGRAAVLVLAVATLCCNKSATTTSPTPVGSTMATVRIVFLGATARRTDLPASAQACVGGVGATHTHPSWRGFAGIPLQAVPPDRYEISFTDVPVGHPFDAHLARSDLTVHVPPGRSLLEAIEAVGVRAPYLCRGGVCGECETDVLDLEGELVHNDHWLSAEQKAGGRKIMPCMSRARCTRLGLDR